MRMSEGSEAWKLNSTFSDRLRKEMICSCRGQNYLNGDLLIGAVHQ
jgi:hypothetical protein